MHSLERVQSAFALEEARERFLARSRSQATARTYAADLRHFFSFLGCHEGVPTIEQVLAVRWRDVARYRDRYYLPDRTGRAALAAETGARRLSVLATFFDELRRSGVVVSNPARDVPRPKGSSEGKTPGLEPSEVTRLLAAVPRGTQRGERDLLLLSMLFFQWLRISEALRVRVEDLGEDAGIPTLRVRQKGGRERVIALREEVARLARDYARRFEVVGFLFPALSPGASEARPMTTEAARQVFRKAAAAAGLSSRVSPHSARVTGITEALLAEVPLEVVQDFAGHARPETTLRYHRARKRLTRVPAAVMPFRLPVR